MLLAQQTAILKAFEDHDFSRLAFIFDQYFGNVDPQLSIPNDRQVAIDEKEQKLNFEC